jgi:hypothetical protein
MGELDKLGGLAKQINEEHRRCEEAVTAALDHALRAGDLLAEAKGKCPHGAWQTWLVESRRVDGKPRQSVLAHLGRYPTVDVALEDLPRRIDLHRRTLPRYPDSLRPGRGGIIAVETDSW